MRPTKRRKTSAFLLVASLLAASIDSGERRAVSTAGIRPAVFSDQALAPGAVGSVPSLDPSEASAVSRQAAGHVRPGQSAGLTRLGWLRKIFDREETDESPAWLTVL